MDRVKRLVVKIGSNVLTTNSHKLSETVVKRLVEDVVELRACGLEVAIVTSGAVAAGMGRMELTRRPEGVGELQALAQASCRDVARDDHIDMPIAAERVWRAMRSRQE